ncbi:GNAT family N-acetyltransferase [Cryptosporangium arvum]|uniref:GNAT family N-acetyltransferase n=1 Tax=Cryptosporangium arvum TaxID=80871 RepID=UPI0004B7A92B|nr:GNAT family N-acetyltransferase [Cryptosporangium arvum]
MRVAPLEPLVAAVQGTWLRRTTAPLPPAGGPASGRTGPVGHAPLNVVVVGDSTAAGCGVTSHREGFACGFAHELTARTGRPVRWEVVGQFGATARRVRHKLIPRVGADFDLAVLLAGGNDVLGGRDPEHWRDDLTAILDALEERAGRVVVAGAPPFARFPGLPGALGRYLAQRADALDDASRAVCRPRPGSDWVTVTEPPPAGFFSADGMHPSAAGYRRWAHEIARQLTGLGPAGPATGALRTAAGVTLPVRDAAAGDLAAVDDLHRRCSTPTLTSRYHAGRTGLSAADWQRMVDPRHGRTLVFADPAAEGSLAGFANLLRTAPEGPVEVALLLRDDWQGVGVGRAAARHLVRVAHRLGGTELVAWTEPANVRAAALLRSVGARPDFSEPGSVRWALRLDQPGTP